MTTTYIGNYFEWTGSTSTMKTYYYAGGTRVAEREGSTLYWLFGDHLSSTSITADSNGNKAAELRYKAWGETRYTYGTTPTSQRYTGQREEASLGLYWYNSRWYSPALSRFVSPDSIIPQPGNPMAWDRYAYVYLNPINLLDPSGHNVCTDDGYCGKLSDTSYQLHMFSEAITEVYDWALKGIWNLGQVKKIYTAGRDIQTYVDGLTNGNGLKWMNKYMGGTIFVHGGLAGNNSFVTGNIIHLTNGWEKGKRSEMHIVHELTHIWDNNSSKAEGRPFEALWVGGGNADLLQTYLGGGIPSGIRWMNGTGGMPLEYQWGAGQYGNNSTADYFAESFMYMIYQPDAIPRSSWEWGADNILKGLIIAETSLIP